jgi:hypothetical protein
MADGDARWEEEAARAAGACAWVGLGLLAFAAVVGYWPVAGVTDAPAYARTLLYMSVAHQFPDVQPALHAPAAPPQPPWFV